MEKNLLYMMALGAALTACDKETIGEYEPQRILLGTELSIDEAETRTLGNGLQWDYLETGTAVGVYIYHTGKQTIDSNYGYKNLSYTSAAKTGSSGSYKMALNLVSADDQPYYPANSKQKVDMYAFAPRAVTTNTANNLSQNTDLSYTLATDQSESTTGITNYRLADFVWGSTTGIDPKTYANRAQRVEIPMKHKMSKVTVIVAEGHGMAGRLAGSNVKLNNVKLTGSINLTNGTAAATTTATASSVTMVNSLAGGTKITSNADYYNSDAPTDGKDHYKYTVSGIVFPQSSVSKTNLITVTLSSIYGNTAYNCSLSADQTFAAGNEYTYKITVNATSVSLTTSVSAWTANNNAGSGQAVL